MSYENAIATRLLATHCVCCGRALVDAISCELGVGPECRQGFNADLTSEGQKTANKLVYEASVAAVAGHISIVLAKAAEVRALGFGELAEKMERRFVNCEVKAAIKIEVEGSTYYVTTPYRRGKAEEFIQAWREIPGRKWDAKRKANAVPAGSKMALWKMLVKYFPGKSGVGPKGVFRLPKAVA